jgi:GntR family transcriptional repressor for pyruvate dehydrogenase complex
MPDAPRSLTSTDDRDRVQFNVVTPNRMSEAIVEQIRSLIRSNQLLPGDRLPSERDLGTKMGVSRVTVREALRVLEAGGLVDIRVGARGGAFVTSPSSTQLGSGLANLISTSPVTAAEVTESRQVVELGVIPLIVERATEADIADLRAMTLAHREAYKRGEYGLAMSAAFHVRLGACTHNAAIEMLIHSFHGPLLMSLQEAHGANPQVGKNATKDHTDLVEAIAARDVEQATTIMRAHLDRTVKSVGKVPPTRAP